MAVCYCSMFCCTLLYVHSSIAIILMGKRELVALLNLSCVLFCLVFAMSLCASAGKGLTSWLSFVVSNCEFVTFPLVSWFRCGT